MQIFKNTIIKTYILQMDTLHATNYLLRHDEKVVLVGCELLVKLGRQPTLTLRYAGFHLFTNFYFFTGMVIKNIYMIFGNNDMDNIMNI